MAGDGMHIPNYQKEMDALLLQLQREEHVPSLLLHSCCAPCSSYVIEYLSAYFSITVFYYNPNLYPDAEYALRSAEQKRLIADMPVKNRVRYLQGDFEKEAFYTVCKGYEAESEGGERCRRCYRLRLDKTAQTAKRLGFDYFATTLTISPLKNAHTINQIGKEIEHSRQICYLSSDFKKKTGFKRSTELSSMYGIYRQNYCGCIFSQRENQKKTSSIKR